MIYCPEIILILLERYAAVGSLLNKGHLGMFI